ncbi:hypothetical protein D6C20_22035 [Escherichia coli]|nr:hypothetical protein [Escherichia coli]EEV5748861.1 hypothetical protein [Escherichia coli]EEV7152647.1 hypothetical protein [Escherichia coli]EEW2729916.1 hypothetical protein [Escherichia coli]EEW7484166.1 hypothetical protein [Escherichia coli]
MVGTISLTMEVEILREAVEYAQSQMDNVCVLVIFGQGIASVSRVLGDRVGGGIIPAVLSLFVHRKPPARLGVPESFQL